MDPSTTHVGRRLALRALTVSGAAVAVMVAAALPAAAADSTATTQTATDTVAASTATTTDATASTTDATTADSTATTATTDTATAAADAAAATDAATTAVADSSATDTATTAVANSAAAPAAPVIHASANGNPGTGTSTSASHSNGTSTAHSHGANAGGNSANAPGKNKDNGTGNGNGNPHNGDHNPPGNNGTVKIHDVAGDTQPYDVPHLSCFGYVDFFGFDEEQTVTVSFTGQAPTGKGIVLPFTWTGVISTDQAGGAGNDFDYELPFTADQLGVTSLGEPAAQGYHIKMLVETGEPGGKKYKVFWIQPCGEETGGGGGHHHHGGGGGGGGHHHHGGGGESSGGSKTPPKVKAVHEHKVTPTQPTSAPRVLAVHDTKVQALPFTGVANLGAEILAALTALTGGAAMSYAGRRRRPAKHRAG